jgi:hypothetical protein
VLIPLALLIAIELPVGSQNVKKWFSLPATAGCQKRRDGNLVFVQRQDVVHIVNHPPADVKFQQMDGVISFNFLTFTVSRAGILT